MSPSTPNYPWSFFILFLSLLMLWTLYLPGFISQSSLQRTSWTEWTYVATPPGLWWITWSGPLGSPSGLVCSTWTGLTLIYRGSLKPRSGSTPGSSGVTVSLSPTPVMSVCRCPQKVPALIHPGHRSEESVGCGYRVYLCVHCEKWLL